MAIKLMDHHIHFATQWLPYIILGLAALIAYVLYGVFRTYASYKQIRKIDEKYQKTFNQRDNLAALIAKCKLDGDNLDMVADYEMELNGLDESLDSMETDIKVREWTLLGKPKAM